MLRVRNLNLWGITILLIVCCFGMVAQGKYGGGTGEPNDPYQIWDANQMQAIGADANDWDKHFILMADIDLGKFDGKNGRDTFNLIGGYIGYDDPNIKPFTGVFDGDDHTILNFIQRTAGGNYCCQSGIVTIINNLVKLFLCPGCG